MEAKPESPTARTTLALVGQGILPSPHPSISERIEIGFRLPRCISLEPVSFLSALRGHGTWQRPRRGTHRHIAFSPNSAVTVTKPVSGYCKPGAESLHQKECMCAAHCCRQEQPLQTTVARELTGPTQAVRKPLRTKV